MLLATGGTSILPHYSVPLQHNSSANTYQQKKEVNIKMETNSSTLTKIDSCNIGNLLTPPNTPGASSVDSGCFSSASGNVLSPPLNLKVRSNENCCVEYSSPTEVKSESTLNVNKRRRFDFANLAKSATEPDEQREVKSDAIITFAATEINRKIIKGSSKTKQSIETLGNTGASNTGRRKRKKFICRFCQRQFTKSYNLLIHERTHTDERPFNCDICGKAFRRQDHLRDHR